MGSARRVWHLTLLIFHDHISASYSFEKCSLRRYEALQEGNPSSEEEEEEASQPSGWHYMYDHISHTCAFMQRRYVYLPHQWVCLWSVT